ncbi:hypothetical protein [Mycobacterium sp. Aquia_213]|uniref:hypothetical protein n=1 Tax=Mycobacterium sp. Aquia_213 TaxID=2991728 RepID=UPI0022719B29|nr:hypothetical protein [Mycobacterium sp. Aquia_213]WAC89312.1 hypothetical protein LMQ14_15040 [Mycobacterium sp. Aquia_213]
MPEPLVVDPWQLELAGSTLQDQVLPVPPPPIAATGPDAVSTAINVTMPMIESPVTEGLPAAQAAITATGNKIAAAARMYAETDQKLGDQLAQAQFTGNKEKAATPGLNAAHSAPQAPAPGGGPQLSSAPPPTQEQLPHSTAPAAGGPGTPDPSVGGGGPPASLTPNASEDAVNPAGWSGPADPEATADPGASGWNGDAEPSDGAVKPASYDGATDSADPSTDQETSGDSPDPADQQSPDGPGTADDPGTTDEPQTADGSQPGTQNGPGPATPDGSKAPGDPRSPTDPTAQKERPASVPPRGTGAGSRGLFSASQPGASAGGRGIPQSLAGSPKPTVAPHRPAAAHAAPPSGPGQPARPMPVGPGGAHAPLSPAAPAAPLSPSAPAPPHGPMAPAMPQAPAPSAAPEIGAGGTGPAAPAAPTSMPLQPATPGTSPVAADPAADTGSKPASASLAPPPPPRGRDAVLASIPVSAARAERDAVAEAATADASRRDGVDPLLLARRIAAALNAGAGGDDDEGDDFGFFWVTAVTTEGTIVVANSYGIAYIPDGVRLPDVVYLASADEEIPAADRASWATYPVIAVQGWASHHEYELRAVIATEDQLADSEPGVEKVELQPDDIPDSGEMIGRTRLEVVDPQAAEWLAAVPDESLRDRLPPAPAEISPPAEEEGMLWFEVMEPMFSTDTGREDAHLRAFLSYASQAEQLALKAAHRRVDAETRRTAIADWLYWKHLAALCDAALSDPAYRRRTAGLYDESATGS